MSDEQAAASPAKRHTRRQEAQAERTMTARDWKALYLVWKLVEQIVLHGADALDTFIDAMVERRRAEPPR